MMMMMMTKKKEEKMMMMCVCVCVCGNELDAGLRAEGCRSGEPGHERAVFTHLRVPRKVCLDVHVCLKSTRACSRALEQAYTQMTCRYAFVDFEVFLVSPQNCCEVSQKVTNLRPQRGAAAAGPLGAPPCGSRHRPSCCRRGTLYEPVGP
jgi:hypothetical protein